MYVNENTAWEDLQNKQEIIKIWNYKERNEKIK